MHGSSLGWRALAATLLAPAAAGGAATAQSLFALDGATSELVEFVGPPQGPFGHPSGPELARRPTSLAFPCATPSAFGPPPFVLGDVAVDKVADTVWVTDGLTVTELTPEGEVLRSFDQPVGSVLPGLLTGLGCDSRLGLLWMTDGDSAVAVLPPQAPGCGQGPTVAVGPFPLPIGTTATDLEWDPQLMALWVCDDAGRVLHVEIDGTLGLFGAYSGTSACGLSPRLQGLALDGAVGSGRLYVTDGSGVAYLELGGAAGPPRFYMSQACTAAPGALLGLASSARGIPFDRAASPPGLAEPRIRAQGQSLIGGGVEVFVECQADTTAYLVLSDHPHCPPPSLPGLSIDLLPPLDCHLSFIGSAPIGPSGVGSVTVPVAGFTAIGRRFLVHWIVPVAPRGVQLTSRLHFSASLY